MQVVHMSHKFRQPVKLDVDSMETDSIPPPPQVTTCNVMKTLIAANAFMHERNNGTFVHQAKSSICASELCVSEKTMAPEESVIGAYGIVADAQQNSRLATMDIRWLPML